MNIWSFVCFQGWKTGTLKSFGPQQGIPMEKAKLLDSKEWRDMDQSLPPWFTCSTLSDCGMLGVHAGGCLGVMKLLDMTVQIKKDLRFIKQMFKNVTEVWSHMVPRKVWCHSVKPLHVLNIHVKKVHRHTGSLMKFIRGCTVSSSNTHIHTHTTFSLSVHLFFQLKWNESCSVA